MKFPVNARTAILALIKHQSIDAEIGVHLGQFCWAILDTIKLKKLALIDRLGMPFSFEAQKGPAHHPRRLCNRQFLGRRCRALSSSIPDPCAMPNRTAT